MLTKASTERGIRNSISREPSFVLGGLLALNKEQKLDEVEQNKMQEILDFFNRWDFVTSGMMLQARKVVKGHVHNLVKLGGVFPVEKIQVTEKKARMSPHGDKILLSVPKYGNYNLLNGINSQYSQATFDWKTGTYKVPLSVAELKVTIELGFLLDARLRNWWEEKKVKISSSVVVEGLRAFQNDAVAFLEAQDGRALIADEMGLGKTIEAIGYILRHPEFEKIIICCPGGLKLNWAKELNKWTNSTVQILNGRQPYPLLCRIIILNYAILPNWIDIILQYKPDWLCFDEAHHLKTDTANRTVAAKKLSREIPRTACLTGTPIKSRAREIYNPSVLIRPELFPSRRWFDKNFCGGSNGNGSIRTKELHDLLTSTIMLRRKKCDVLPELPAKVHSVIPLEITNRKEYDKVEKEFLQWLKENYPDDPNKVNAILSFQVLTQIEFLKQASIHGKIKPIIEWVDNFFENEDKLVLFCEHKWTIKALQEEYGDSCVTYFGEVSTKNREIAKDKFQKDPSIKLFLGNKAAEEGITLTASYSVAFVEFPWTPGELTQRIDRTHRIGQEADCINIYYLIGEKTIDEYIMALLEEKSKIFSSILDGEDIESDTVLTEVIARYQEKIRD